MALKLKVLKVPTAPPQNDEEDANDPGEGTSRGPVKPPQAEARTRHHIYNQSAVQGW